MFILKNVSTFDIDEHLRTEAVGGAGLP